MLVLFDVVGTVFSLDRASAAMTAAGAPAPLFETFFARLLQGAMACSMAGTFHPFDQLARTTLHQQLAAHGLSDAAVAPTLAALKELDPYPDAAACLRTVRAAGHTVAALTNSGAASTHAMLARAGLSELLEQVVSVEEVHAYKPLATPYRHAVSKLGATPSQTVLVAAHAWDVQGAAAAGLRAVWLRRSERAWPFPGDPPGPAVDTLADVPAALPTH